MRPVKQNQERTLINNTQRSAHSNMKPTCLIPYLV